MVAMIAFRSANWHAITTESRTHICYLVERRPGTWAYAAAAGCGERIKVASFVQLARGPWQGSAVPFGEASLRSAERVYMMFTRGLNGAGTAQFNG
jgi:hypothetical protein